MKQSRSVILVLSIALAILAVCEGVARRELPKVPSAMVTVRNPFRYRAWPEYMGDPSGRPNRPTVLLLTNSQGYGAEYPSYIAYPGRLERLLRYRRVGGRSDWEVLNWAVDGVTSMEYTLMAAYAREHPPTMVLAVTSYPDYRDEHFNLPLSYCRSDIPRLISRWHILKSLPRSYIKRHVKIEDFLAYALLDHLALSRFREYFWSWLDRRFPGVLNVFYAPQFSYLPWALPKEAITEPIRLPRRALTRREVTYGDGSRVMLQEYIDMLSRIPSTVVFVAEPTTAGPDHRFQAPFLEDAARMTEQAGIPFWNLNNALPRDRFLSTGHLERKNHVRMSEILADRIADLVGGMREEAPAQTPPDSSG